MNRAFIKYFLLFFLLLALCFGGLGLLLKTGKQSVENAGSWVVHSQMVISKAQNLNVLLERMLANQRGYMLSGGDKLKKDYRDNKSEIGGIIAELRPLTADNSVQAARLGELQTRFLRFTKLLDARMDQYRLSPNDNGRPSDPPVINSLKDNLVRLSNDVLNEEYRLLDIRIENVQAQRRHSFHALIFGGCVAAILLLVFNGLMFVAQSGQLRAEKKLGEAQEIFRLAMEGTRDGIYDWNLKTGEARCSAPFWSTLGYGAEELPASMQSFESLIHPGDRQRLSEYREKYLREEEPEYSIIFRVKHRDGHWIWISSRGKAIYDANNEPVRMVGAHTDITPIKAYEEKLEKARDRAEKASRAKSEFLAHMSHEIRTPLTAISGIAEIFGRNQSNLDDKQKLLVKTLQSSSSLLNELVNDVLDFSRIESGELKLEDKLFPLADMFEQVINVTAAAAREKNIDFKFDYSALENVSFMGDRTRLRQILINLVSNAVKFTTKGSVTVKADKFMDNGAAKLRVNVADTGIGIDPKNFDMIFEQFKQADSSISRRYGGTGLGLAISLRLAQLMAGTILLKSTPGKGSTFSLVIPLRTGDAADDGASDEARNGVLTERIRALSLKGKRILLVEDYEGNVVMLGYILDSLDCVYDVAHTGREALALWEKTRYDLILMDIQMPDMDGLTATAAIRQLETEKKMKRVPIIGMTAHALMGDANKCIEAGMDFYLPKPIAEIDLKARIAECLTQARQAA